MFLSGNHGGKLANASLNVTFKALFLLVELQLKA